MDLVVLADDTFHFGKLHTGEENRILTAFAVELEQFDSLKPPEHFIQWHSVDLGRVRLNRCPRLLGVRIEKLPAKHYVAAARVQKQRAGVQQIIDVGSIA